MPANQPAPRRTYDSTRRHAEARQRRAAILDACRTVLVRDGYSALTIRSVAEAAAVSQETIFKTFVNKRGLVKAMYDVTLAGDDEDIPMAQRPAVRAITAEPDAGQRVKRYARVAREVGDRLGAVSAAIAASGGAAAEITADTDRERIAGTRAFVGGLATEGLLRPGLPVAEAADACWVLISPQVYQLCLDRGWTSDAYEAWLARQLAASLL